MGRPESADVAKSTLPHSGRGALKNDGGLGDQAATHRQLGKIQWRLLAISILFAGFFTACIAILWHAPQPYPDVIAGAITAANENKSKELAELITFLISSMASYYGLAAGARIAIRRANGDSGWLDALLNVPLILTAYWLGAQIVNLDRKQLPVEALIGSVFLLITVPALVRLPGASSSALERAGWLLFLDLLLLVFGGLALGFVTALVFPALLAKPWKAAAVYTSAGTLAAVLLLLRSSDLPGAVRKLTRYTYLLQIPMPLLFFSLLPRPMLYHEHRMEPPHTRLLSTVIAVFCVWAWSRLYRRSRRKPVLTFALRNHMEPLCLAAVTVCFVYFVGYPTILADDFHFGEQYLPWQQLVQFGRLPYVDLIPIHGSMALVEGAIGSLFFQGTTADFYNSVTMLEAAAAAITFLCLYRAAGLGAALLYCLAITHFNRLYLFGPVLIFIVVQRPFRSVLAWLAVAAAGLLAITYNVAVGLASAIGVLPAVLRQSYLLWRSSRAVVARLAAVFAGIFIVCIAVPVLRNVCLGFVRFTVETGNTNTVAHAMLWTGFVPVKPPTQETLVSPALFAALKYGWIGFVLVAAAALISDAVRGFRRLWLPRNDLPWAIALSSVAMISWTSNRVSEGLSRPGLFSAYCAAVFLPVFLFRLPRRPGRTNGGGTQSWLLVGVACLLGMYAAQTESMAGIRQASARLIPLAPVPDDLTLVTPASSGLPNMGTSFLPAARVAEIDRFQAAVSNLVGPSGSYFDLTNRQALYAYTRRREPALYASAYVAVSHQQQQRILAQLAAHHENLVYAAPAMRFDGLPVSLRSYLLYRYVMLNYQPCKIEDNVFFIDATLNRGHCENVPPGELMDSSFARWDIGRLPSAWGNSWSSLQKLFRPFDAQLVGTPADGLTWDGRRFTATPGAFDEEGYLSRYPDVAAAVRSGALSGGHQHYTLYGQHEGRVGGARASIQIDFAGKPADPREYDFLTFRLVPESRAAAVVDMQLKWSTGAGEIRQPVVFQLEGDRALVPLGSYPQWLMADAIHSIRVSLDNMRPGSSFELREIQLLHYLPGEVVKRAPL